MKSTILISKSLIDDLRLRANKGKPNEVGGYLTGSRTNMGLVVSKATGPYKEDKSSRTKFSRCDEKHSKSILKAWRQSKTKETLIGDWHSHTSNNLEYSIIDRNGWMSMINKNESPMVGLIVNSSSYQMYLLTSSRHFSILRAQKIVESQKNILLSCIE